MKAYSQYPLYEEIERDTLKLSTTMGTLPATAGWTAQAERGCVPDELLDFRRLIEELRVSLFVQELKTPFPGSVKRLEKIWSAM